jgi:UDP-N-acetylglucosamine transferase subunit ALG13
MIFVTVGTNGAPFDRLLRALDDIGASEELIVQHGPSQVRPRGAKCIPFLPFSSLSDLIASASTVITHAGAGSILIALAHGKRPIVVPRLPEFSEVVDNHQLVLARHLARSELVILAEDPSRLSQVLAAGPRTDLQRNGQSSGLVQELSVYLRSLQLDSAPTEADGDLT